MSKPKWKKLVLKKELAVKLFKALGFKTVEKWDDKRLAKKVETLPSLVEGVRVKNPKLKAILEKILAVGKVILETPEKTKKEAVGEKVVDKSVKDSRKKKVSKKKVSKKKVDKKKVGGKDKFGSSLGSNAAKINASLSGKPKTMKELVKMSVLKGSYYNHLSSLVVKGFVKKTADNKFVLRKK